MTWYAAHIVVYAKFLDGVQDKYPVWENVVLIEADSSDEGFSIAEKIGKNDYKNSTLSTMEERPFDWEFVGVRKLVTLQLTKSFRGSEDSDIILPKHGTEITYFELELPTFQSLQSMMTGETVGLKYE